MEAHQGVPKSDIFGLSLHMGCSRNSLRLMDQYVRLWAILVLQDFRPCFPKGFVFGSPSSEWTNRPAVQLAIKYPTRKNCEDLIRRRPTDRLDNGCEDHLSDVSKTCHQEIWRKTTNQRLALSTALLRLGGCNLRHPRQENAPTQDTRRGH